MSEVAQKHERELQAAPDGIRQQETKMDEPKQALTEGEYRVGISFNPSNNALVDDIKRKAAEVIDLMDRAVPADINESRRLASLAMTAFEEGAMWGVKAVTKQPR